MDERCPYTAEPLQPTGIIFVARSFTFGRTNERSKLLPASVNSLAQPPTQDSPHTELVQGDTPGCIIRGPVREKDGSIKRLSLHPCDNKEGNYRKCIIYALARRGTNT